MIVVLNKCLVSILEEKGLVLEKLKIPRRLKGRKLFNPK